MDVLLQQCTAYSLLMREERNMNKSRIFFLNGDVERYPRIYYHKQTFSWKMSPNFKTLKEPRNRFQRINSSSLCSPVDRYDVPNICFSSYFPNNLYPNLLSNGFFVSSNVSPLWEQSCHQYSPISNTSYRRKIRLIEGNAKCRNLKKFTLKGTLQQVSVWGPETHTFPPLHTVYV